MTCKILLLKMAMLFSINAFATDYQIYSIFHELPMENNQQNLTKNFYVNVGEEQGVKEGTILDVYRSLSVLDPYDTKRRYNHKIKVGEVKVIHSDLKSSIAIYHELKKGPETPQLDVQNFMVGDSVNVKLK